MEFLLFGNGYGYKLINGLYYPTATEGVLTKSIFEHDLVKCRGLDDCFGLMVCTYGFLKENIPHRAKVFLEKYDPQMLGLKNTSIGEYDRYARLYFKNKIPYYYEEKGTVITVHYLHVYLGTTSTCSYELREPNGDFNQELWLELTLLQRVSFDKLMMSTKQANPLFFPFYTFKKNTLHLDHDAIRDLYERHCKVGNVDSFFAYKRLIEIYGHIVSPCALEHFTNINEEDKTWTPSPSDISLLRTSKKDLMPTMC